VPNELYSRSGRHVDLELPRVPEEVRDRGKRRKLIDAGAPPSEMPDRTSRKACIEPNSEIGMLWPRRIHLRRR
jgi:hypothetical protein